MRRFWRLKVLKNEGMRFQRIFDKENKVKNRTWKVLIVLVTAACLGAPAAAQESVANKYFSLQFNSAGVTSLKRSPLTIAKDFILQDKTLGDIIVRYRMGDQAWQDFITAEMVETRTIKQGAQQAASQQIIVYNGSGWYDYYADLELTTRLRLEGDALFWTLHFRNVTHKPVEIGNFLLPLPFDSHKSLKMKSFIAGHGSYLTWSPNQAEEPVLVMTPVEKCPLFEPAQTERNFAPVSLEYLDEKGVYIHSLLLGDNNAAQNRKGNLPQTSHILTPKFTPGDEITYAFKFRWADDEEQVRQLLYEEGLFDLNIVPGTSLAPGKAATLSLRSKNSIKSVDAEYVDQTTIEDLGGKDQDTRVYKVTFSQEGKNLLTVTYGSGRKMYLQFTVEKTLMAGGRV